MKNAIFIMYLVFFAFSISQAQEKSVDKPKNRVRVDHSNLYKNWLKKDVVYIITKDETDAFLKLKTDEEREQFVENFWRRRDPAPDTELNEFREE